MNCQEVYEKIDCYLRGELPENSRREFEEHLDECVDCCEAVQRAQELTRVLTGASIPPVPEGFADDVMSEARSQMAEREKSRTILGPFYSFFDDSTVWRAAVAAGVLVGLGLGILMGYGATEIRTETRMPSNRTVSADPARTYRLDYIAGNPPDSLSRAFVEMTGPEEEGRD